MKVFKTLLTAGLISTLAAGCTREFDTQSKHTITECGLTATFFNENFVKYFVTGYSNIW